MKKYLAMFLVLLVMISLSSCKKDCETQVKEQLEKVADSISFSSTLTSDLILPKNFDNGIKAAWLTSDASILTNQGKVNLPKDSTIVKLWLTLSLESEEIMREFTFTTAEVIDFDGHMIIDGAGNYPIGTLNNLEIGNDGSLQLTNGSLEGSYLSNIFCTKDFSSLVGSWSALSSETTTVELFIRVRVDDNWSDFLSYGEWGLGRENKGRSYISSDDLVEIKIDEVMIRHGKLANAVQYKVIIRRYNSSSPSAQVSLIGIALEIPNYQLSISEDNLPVLVNYAVPKLNQNVVPDIGPSICSPTSVAMLLQYYGEDLSDKDPLYPQRYIARLVRDYGNSIYGNWPYNTAVIGAMGKESYVMRMYSIVELKAHLANVGPVVISVRGDMEGKYTTNGHLLVVTGYKTNNGITHFICNDPNISEVSCEYTEDTIVNVWRKIAYVVL